MNNYITKHKEFVISYKKIITTLDIILILSIMLSFFSVFMTNLLVVKVEPEAKLVEMNPVTAEALNLEEHPESKGWLKAVTFNTVFCFVMFSLYVCWRRYVHKEWHLTFLIIFTLFLSYVLSLDFFNNLGYYIGKIIYGG